MAVKIRLARHGKKGYVATALRLFVIPTVLIASSAGLRVLLDTMSELYGHPRSTGTMVRRLELVRDFRLRTMEESVKNLTWDTAQALKLPEQGLLKEGWDANVCVIDYDRLHATADYKHPRRRNQGIHHVLVNGVVALRNGEPTDTRSGKVIKRGK